MQEEAINTAIIQETEEELQQINKSLYKVWWYNCSRTRRAFVCS